MAANGEPISASAGSFTPVPAAGSDPVWGSTDGRWQSSRIPGVVAAAYFVLSLGWILLSDQVVAEWANSGSAGTIKGCAFVAVSAALLYAALRRQEIRWRRESAHRLEIESELRASEQRLRKALAVAERAAELARRSEARQRASEARFATIFRSNPIGTTLSRLDNAMIIDVNDVFLRESGYNREELIGRTSLELGFWGDGSPRRALVDQLLAHGSVSNMEMVACGKRGTPRDLVISFELIELEGERFILGMWTDVTERKRALHAQRLEAIGTLASGIAHDLNNILSPILVIPDLLRPACPAADERELLGMIEQSARRGADIVKQLLTFSRGSEAMRFPLQVEQLVAEMARLIRETFPREIEVREELAGELPLVAVDATQIDQVLLNLCVNARDAMPDGGRLTLEVSSVQLDQDAGRLHRDARPGGYVIVRVRDTGSGIDPEIANRIFDPFFTTKAIGRGTGLGLSTALGIVKGHQGFITVESAVGAGSVFSIYLPVASPDGIGIPELSTPPVGAAHGARVLIVDDEPAVAEAMRLVLERHGYSVMLAADGEEALHLLERGGSDVHLMVSDMIMPRMGGVGLLQRLRQVAPALPVIMTTGSIERVEIEQLHALGISGLLQKPVSAAAFMAAVQEALS